MKHLVLVRHGKSSWEYSVGDKDRPLKERGINDAHLVANAFKQQNFVPDVVYSSPANRALHTCLIFLRELQIPLEKLHITNELYDFSGESVLQFIRELNTDLTSVMIFGHNYAFTNVANQLGNKSIDNVPTSGLVHINLQIDIWQELKQGTTREFIFPKALKA